MMAREINSHGVKYAGIYVRELPWKLTADVAAQLVCQQIENARRGGGGGGGGGVDG